MLALASSELLRSRPSNELCFLALSLPNFAASAGVRYHGRSDSSPHQTSGVPTAASFRASTLCPDARALPRFGALCSPGAPSPDSFQPSARARSPGFTRASSEPRHPAKLWGRPSWSSALSPRWQGASSRYAVWPRLPTALFTGSTLRLTAQFFASWPTAPCLTATHCHLATSPYRASTRTGL